MGIFLHLPGILEWMNLPVPGKLPEPADNCRWSCKVLAVETLLDRYHSSEKQIGYGVDVVFEFLNNIQSCTQWVIRVN